MTDSQSDHPVQNSSVQSERIESASDRAEKDAAEYHVSTGPADTQPDHPTGQAQATENVETEPPG